MTINKSKCFTFLYISHKRDLFVHYYLLMETFVTIYYCFY